MANVILSSVADGIPFDPSLPGTIPTDDGNLLRWSTSSGTWIGTGLLRYHIQAGITTSQAISNNGVLNLTSTSDSVLFLTGSGTNYSVILPNATTLVIGLHYRFYNTTSNTITIKRFDGTTVTTLAQLSYVDLELQDNATTAGTWLAWQILLSGLASGIIQYNIISSTAFVSSIRYPTFDPITSFTVTPQAGTYAVWYNASSIYSTTPKTHYWAIYKNATQITDSLRNQDTAHSNQAFSDSTMTVANFNGTDTVNIYVSCDNTGSLTVNQRSLLLLRLGV